MNHLKYISDADLALARSLRAQNMRWYRIAKRIGCAAETIRRRLDPEFDAACAERYKVRARDRCGPNDARLSRDRLSDEQQRLVQRADVRRSADLRFQAAMVAAIERGEEAASIGINTRPSSPDGRFRPARFIPAGSLIGSSAGMCEES